MPHAKVKMTTAAGGKEKNVKQKRSDGKRSEK